MNRAVFLPVNCLAWVVPALEPTGCWVEPSFGTKTPDSKRAHANEYSPVSLISSILVPRVSHIHTLSSQGKLQDEQVGLTQTPVSSRLLLLVSVCTRAGVCPLRAESQFPSICRAPPVKPTAFRAKLPGAFSSRCQTPQPGEPHMGSELSHLYKKFCNKFILQFVGHPHGDLGMGYTVSAALLTMVSSLCLWM